MQQERSRGYYASRPHVTSTAPHRSMKYDVIGVALPAFILPVAMVLYAAVWLLLGDPGRAARGAGTIAIYALLSLFFAYVPYLTGYIGFRIASLAGTLRTSMQVAGGTLAFAFIGGLAFVVAGRIEGAVVLGVVLGIPGLAGIVAGWMQHAGEKHPLQSVA